MEQDQKNFEILKIAADVRKFEIGLFWSRSLFFWGFSAVVIAAYGAAHHLHSKQIELAVSCAGLVISFIWSLVNRSSKYWQKIWEGKATQASLDAIGYDMFKEPTRPIIGIRPEYSKISLACGSFLSFKTRYRLQ